MVKTVFGVIPRSRVVTAAAVVLLTLFLLQCIGSLRQKSPAWDETHYLGIGKYLLMHRSWDIPGSILHPPLAYCLSSIPLLFYPTPEISPYTGKNRQVALGLADIARGNRILMSDAYDGKTLLALARLSMLPVAFLLGVIVFLWGKYLYSARAGLLSLFLYSFSPNLLAHARLITPDCSLACFASLSLFFYWRFSTAGQYRNLLYSAVFLGLALLTKYSALLLFPAFTLIALVTVFLDSSSSSNPMRMLSRELANLVVFFSLALILVVICYGGNPSPFLEGVLFQLKKSRWGHAAFLNGTVSWSGWWYYLIYAFLVKTPVPTLLLTLAAVASGISRKALVERRVYILLIPIAVYLFFFSFLHSSIGLRYLLPVYPLLFVFSGRILDGPLESNRVFRGLLILLALWYLLGTVRTYPHYLAYFNELVGGSRNGYRHLVDSNLDWGQDLPLLKRYMDEQGIDEIGLDYFGSVDPALYGISYRKVNENTSPLPGGWLAISVTRLQGVYSPAGGTAYAALKGEEPVARIGHTIFLYFIG